MKLFGIVAISAVTNIVEYGLFRSLGWYLFEILKENNIQLSPEMDMRIGRWVSESGRIILRLPLFAAFLVLLGFGAKRLVQDLPNKPAGR